MFQKNDGSLAIYLVYKEGLSKEIIYQGGGLVKRGDFQEKDVNLIKYLIENELAHSFR